MEPTSAYEAGQAFGRAAVYWIFGLAVLGGGIFFIVAMFKSFTRKTRGWIIGSIAAGVIAFGGVVGLIGAVANSLAKVAKVAAEKEKTMASADGRYRLEVPANWSEIFELHDDAGIKAGNRLRDQYVVVIENLKTDYVGSLAEIDQLLSGSMEENLSQVEISPPESRETGGYPALHRRIEGTADNVRIAYQMALIETDSAYYQILLWTLPSRESDSLPLFRKITDSFVAVSGRPAPKTAKPAASAGTRERVQRIVTDLLGTRPDDLKLESRFVEDLGADELDTVELVMAVEEEFGVAIPDEAAGKFHTVDDLVRWIDLQQLPVE